MFTRFALAMLSLAAVSCAQTESASRVRLVSACDDFSGEARQRCLDERGKPSPRALSGGRAAGAGGSHAPGGTGLGIGTMGADNAAEQGAVR